MLGLVLEESENAREVAVPDVPEDLQKPDVSMGGAPPGLAARPTTSKLLTGSRTSWSLPVTALPKVTFPVAHVGDTLSA